ncbi:MAG: transposase domain-containing protein [Acetanaerobacterium sp.]
MSTKDYMIKYSIFVVCSIIETVKANGLIPFQYLKFLLETIPNITTSKLDAILPWGEAVPENCRIPLKP